MNERFIEPHPATTQAAEGLPRRSWSLAEIDAMVAAGILGEDERFELLAGDAVPMAARTARHELVRGKLNHHLQCSKDDDVWAAAVTTLRLDEYSFLEPDFCVFPKSIAPGDMRGHDVLLAIEIADSSLRYDLGRKIGIYAAYGIAEVWVIDANTLVTHVHRRLGAVGYADIFTVAPAETLTAARVPSVSMSLERLGLKPI